MQYSYARPSSLSQNLVLDHLNFVNEYFLTMPKLPPPCPICKDDIHHHTLYQYVFNNNSFDSI